MTLRQEDDLTHNRPDLQRLSSDGSNAAVPPTGKTLSAQDRLVSTGPGATMSSTTLSSSSAPSHIQDDTHSTEGPAPMRAVDRNWARVRQKMLGNDSTLNLNKTPQISGVGSGIKKAAAPSASQPPLSNTLRPHSTQTTTDVFKSSPATEGSGSAPPGRKTVLGFRTVVVQRTQLRKMEKEIEKALLRHANDQIQPRSRTVSRIGTGTRGAITSSPYNFIALQENVSVDKNFIEDLTEILQRWKSLTVEVPCKKNILRALSKMLRVDHQEPLSSRT